MPLPLKRKQVVNLFSLDPFHRFYFFTDGTKKVWQVKEHIKIRYGFIWKKLTVCINDNNEEKRFDSKRSVIFLRDNYIKAA